MTYNVFGGTLSLTQSINQVFKCCLWIECVDADIYKEKSEGSAKAQFSVDEVCSCRILCLVKFSNMNLHHSRLSKDIT